MTYTRFLLPKNIFFYVAVGLSLAYLVFKSVLYFGDDADFRYIWMAGQLWSVGVDPYSASFMEKGVRFFPDGNQVAYWLYPPQWWFIARPLANLPHQTALLVWRGGNGGLVLLSIGVLIQGLRHMQRNIPLWYFAPMIVYAGASQATALVLSMGQTSITSLLGISLAAYAICTGRTWPMLVGLIICCLKPQIGIVLAAGLMAQRRWRPTVAAAGIISLAMTAPQTFAFGLQSTVSNFLHNLSMYGTLPPNQPGSLTGMVHVLYQLGLVASALQCIAIGAILSFILFLHLGDAASTRDRSLLIVGLVSIVTFIVPLHSYDFVLFTPICLFILPLRRSTALAMAIAAALTMRAGNLGNMVFHSSSPFGTSENRVELLLLTLAGAIVLLFVMVEVARRLIDKSRVGRAVLA